jgi:hypothetical protein
MATEGYVKFIYHSKSVPPYYGNNHFPELVDDETITIETPSIDLSYHQYFAQFKKFLMALGFNEKNVMQGACHLAFNESNDEKVMREVADEYELIMSEQLPDIIADSKKQDEEWIKKNDESWEQRYWALYRKMQQIESEPDSQLADKVQKGYSYWDEDISNQDMWDQGVMKVSTNIPDPWNGLVPGSPQAKEQGCICPILDNEEMPNDKKWVDVACPIHGKKI